jgi:hypothetical protein
LRRDLGGDCVERVIVSVGVTPQQCLYVVGGSCHPMIIPEHSVIAGDREGRAQACNSGIADSRRSACSAAALRDCGKTDRRTATASAVGSFVGSIIPVPDPTQPNRRLRHPAPEAKIWLVLLTAKNHDNASHARGRWFETSRAHVPETLHSGDSVAAGDLEPASGIPSVLALVPIRLAMSADARRILPISA